MKIFTNKKVIPKVIIAIVIVLLFNFIVPSYSQASFGGVLLGPVIDLVAGIGDAIFAALQYFMYDGGTSILSTAGAALNGLRYFSRPDEFILTNEK